MSLLANSNAIESGGYNIDRSLRFRSSASAYLNRTPASAGNRTTWTWSGWVKRGLMSNAAQCFLSVNNGVNTENVIRFNASDNINFYTYASGYTGQIETTQVFRDPSSWYHIVAVWDTTNATSTDRMRIYVNGNRVTSFATTNYPSQNTVSEINSNVPTNIGKMVSGTQYLDGYLAEVNFIDGQALTPSSFGQTDATTGVWVPARYTGSYGTNGFYLPFTNTTSATTLAYDASGNGNNWTPNNISTTAGATYDSMTDVPTLTSATAANFAVLNPIATSGGTFSNGNLDWQSATVDQRFGLSTVPVTSTGKWYCEVTIGSKTGTYWQLGAFGNPTTALPRMAYRSDGVTTVDSTNGSTWASYTTNDVIGMAFDSSTNQITFYKNNALQGTLTATTTGVNYYFGVGSDSSGGYSNYSANFGQRPFSYTPPTGFKALNTFNLPDPTIKKPNQYMDATLWTGNGTSLTVSNAAGFAPDLVWVKGRSYADNHTLWNTVVGAQKSLSSDTTTAETTRTTALTAFTSTGFTLGSDTIVNYNGNTSVGWQWKKGATPGFDIVTWTGTGFGYTVNHNLGVAPAMIIVKNRSASPSDWWVYHKNLSSGYGINLNTTGAQQSGAWGSITSTTFPIGSLVYSGGTTNYVAYLFAEIAGFSKFGSYTGNGSADGPFVYCGFRPKYVLAKQITAGYSRNWVINTSNMPDYNVTDRVLFPNLSNAETDSALDFLSNGFKVRNTYSDHNVNGVTYIYAAFAENPFKYSNAR